MKIAFVTTADPFNVSAWSGTVSYMYRALEAAGHEMIPVGNLKNKYTLVNRFIYSIVRRICGKRYLGDRETLVLDSYARQINRRLKGVDYDVVFCHLPWPASRLSIKKPVFFFADAAFAGMIDFYECFSNLWPRSIAMGLRNEARALSNVAYAFYSSDWAAEWAQKQYGVSSEKVAVVPFGANIECSQTRGDVVEIIKRRGRIQCELLLLGVDWVRKGGDLVVAVATELNRRGIDTILHVVGCQPDKPVPSFVKLHGFISKKTEDGRQRLNTFLSDSHFLVVPSEAECYGLVYCEASSFGLPSLATQVGGIPTIVKEGENGFLFSLGADAVPYADCIENYFNDQERYESLCLRSFKRFEQYLNWSVSAELITKYLTGERLSRNSL